MNSIFPFWTNALVVHSANGTVTVSNGLRVTGGPGRLTHLSRAFLLPILHYINPHSTVRYRHQQQAEELTAPFFGKKKETVSSILLPICLQLSDLICTLKKKEVLFMIVCAILWSRLQPWKASTRWLASFWSSALSRAAGRFLCMKLMTAQGTEITLRLHLDHYICKKKCVQRISKFQSKDPYFNLNLSLHFENHEKNMVFKDLILKYDSLRF